MQQPPNGRFMQLSQGSLLFPPIIFISFEAREKARETLMGGKVKYYLTSFTLFYENKFTIDCHCYATFKEALQIKYILLNVW